MKKRYQAFPSNEILDNLKFKEAQGYLSKGEWIQTNEFQGNCSGEII